MPTIDVIDRLVLPEDASGNPLERIQTGRWHPQRIAVPEDAWVALPTTPMDGRTSLLIQSLPTNADMIILAPAATGYSNDPTQATCGIILPVGSQIEPDFADNLLVYARVIAGGTPGAVIVSEAR